MTIYINSGRIKTGRRRRIEILLRHRNYGITVHTEMDREISKMVHDQIQQIKGEKKMKITKAPGIMKYPYTLEVTEEEYKEIMRIFKKGRKENETTGAEKVESDHLS